MLGLGSGEMALAFILSVLSAIFCVIYGLVKWNSMGRYAEGLEEKVEWERKDKKLKEKLP
ncbi:MAG: symporter small accessory protein [Pseudomonadota bacterium]